MMPTTGIAMRRTEEMIQNARLSRSGSGLAPAEASVVLRASLRGFPTPLVVEVLFELLLPLALSDGMDAASELASTTVCTAMVAVPSSVAACQPTLSHDALFLAGFEL
jgi:hypothetical protein